MSLINKMLTDLETRQNPAADQGSPGDIYRDLHAAAGTSKRSWRVVVVILVCTTAVAVMGAFAWNRVGSGGIAEWLFDWGKAKAAQQQVARAVQAPVAEERQNDSGAHALNVVSPTVRAGSSERKPSRTAVATQTPAALVSLAEVEEAVSSRAAAEAASSSKVALAVSSRKGTAGKTLSKPAVVMPQPKSGAKAATRNNEKTNTQSKTASPASQHTPQPISKEKRALPAENTATRVSAQSQRLRSPPTSNTQQGAVEKKVKSLTAEEQAENGYRKGVRRLQENRLSDAEMELRQALASNPRQVEARELLAELLLRKGHLNEAQQLLEEGRQLVPRHYRFAQLLGRLYVQSGADGKGLALLEQVQDDAQEDAEFLGFLAALYQRTSRHQEAIKTYTRAVILDPEQSRWWAALGISLEAEQRWGAAYNVYMRALGGQQLDPKLVRYAKQRLALLRERVATADAAKVPAAAARGEESHASN